jgi:hypothetical protein
MNAEKDEDTTEAKPEITKIETTFPIEDGIRTNRRGDEFSQMQSSDIEFGRDGFDREDAINRVTIYLENGARIAYWHIEKDKVEERTYKPDGGAVWDSVDIELSIPRPGVSAHGDFVSCVEQSLDVYMSDSLEQMKTGWSTVAEVISE